MPVWGAGDAYEPFIGRWSRLVAERFLAWLDQPPGRRWLDVGCGTGALTAAVLRRCAPAEVLAVDPSPGFAEWAAAHIDDPRARFAVADAEHLPEDAADVAVSGLVLNFVPDTAAALAAMRAAAPAGTVAAYVWDYTGRMELLQRFWAVAAELDPAAGVHYEGVRYAICHPGPLEELWRDAGLAGVAVEGIEVATPFRDFDDYWTPFLGGQGPAPGYVLSLDDEGRARLRERLRARLPAAADGSIDLVARAWAVRGHAP